MEKVQKTIFFEKSWEFIWWLHKNSVPLHPQIRNRPLRLAQVGQDSSTE